MASTDKELDRRLTEEDLPKPPPGLRFELWYQDRAAAINDFVNQVFETERSVEGAIWKYFQVHPEASVGVAIQEEDNTLVGAHPNIIRRLWLDGRELPIFHIADVAISPHYRRGIALYRSFIRHVQVQGVLQGVLFGYGGRITEENRKIGKRLVGYEDLMQLETLERRLSLRMAVSKRVGHALGEAAGAVGSAFYKARYRGSHGSWTVEEAEKVGFGPEYDRLWESLRERHRICLVRDAAVLNWRYSENPASGFHLFEAKNQSGDLSGFLVMRVYSEGDAKLALVLDLQDQGEAAMAQALLEGATAAAVHQGCDFLRFAPCPGSSAAQAVAAAGGFREAPVPRDNVIFKSLAPSAAAYGEQAAAELLAGGGHWYYTQGDSDFLE
ncbi:MAG: hypothetical protein DWQ01_18825 [Planctomycetota bacterium]|nr:MAG: hypothetical protein DWQ01_18825 [Planctomycetota bacterium]